jgi:hypothetical protein
MPGITFRLSTTAGLLLLLAVSTASPQTSTADSLPPAPHPGRGPIVRSLRLERENIFGPEEHDSRRLYARAANALHRVTTEHVIRRGLYFSEGDTLRAGELDASLRRLRAYPFLRSDATAEVIGAGDSVDVRIRTHDVWSTQPTLTFSREGGLLNWTAGLHETNFAGLGKDLLALAGQTDRQTYGSLGYGDYQLFGSAVRLLATVTHGRDIDAADAWLTRPRDRAAVRWALDGEAHRFLGRVVDRRGGLEGPEYRGNTRSVLWAAGPRVVGRSRSALWVMPALQVLDARFAPAADRHGWRGGPAGLGPGGPVTPLRERKIRAIGVAAGLLQEGYSVWSCVETLRRCEDVNLGASAWLMAGASSPRFGAARDALYWRLEGRRGIGLGSAAYALLGVSGYGLIARGTLSDARFDATLRLYDRLAVRHTLALRLAGSVTRDLAPQDLPTMGAESGLRGFDAYDFWGDRVALANVEDRMLLLEDALGLVSIGAVAFLDGGLARQAGAERAARPRICAGGGLRLEGTRTGGNLVTRIDLGHPIAGGEPGHGWILSVATGQAF